MAPRRLLAIGLLALLATASAGPVAGEDATCKAPREKKCASAEDPDTPLNCLVAS